ncbi:MAG: VWA domain-containing protein, partial [Armatimonadetes bacterium]|nr:VWA domain-containing protein [Armatimonadota bacterium]
MSFEACAACQTANPLHREHCLGCGIRIRLRCLHCWRLHPVDAERCGRSGLFIPNEWRTAPPFQYRLRPWLDRWRAARKPVAAIALVALLLTLPRGNTVPLPTPPGPRIDVCFLIDSTGSMGDEIDVVKARVVKMMDQIQAGKPRPRVRFGVVAFRDKGDEYLTRACDFSGDSQRVRAF